MDLENDSEFDSRSLFPTLSDHESLSNQPRLDRIDSNLFHADDQSLHLERLFDTRHSAFVEKESVKFSTAFRTQYSHYQSRFMEHEPATIERVIKLPNFRRNCLAMIARATEKWFEAIFTLKPNSPVDEFVNNLYHKSFELCFTNISAIADYIGEAMSPRTPSDLEVPPGTAKKVPWTQAEEKELFGIVTSSYPLSVPSEALAAFCAKYNRTRSGVTNKIHKFKRKFESEFRQKNVDIFSEFIEGSGNQGMEQSVLNVIQSENVVTYESILLKLRIQNSQIEERDLVNQILYDLLDRNRIRCDERIFVELLEAPQTCLASSPTLIIKRVVEVIAKKRDLSIGLEDLRDVLMEEFQINDKKREELDAHLTDFLQQSKFFVLRQKRVFY
jgi:hypothetical protein